jgi:hypothetical protein
MARFEGSIQEFHHFMGPRIKNIVNNLTRTYRKQRDGICEHCGERKELHSAHVYGRGRMEIIENVLSAYTQNGIVSCDIGEVERKILEAHLPIESSFKFLCQDCHVAYDVQIARPAPRTAKQRNKPNPPRQTPGEFKKIHRIELWARRPEQANHKIVAAYLHLEKAGEVRLEDLKALCSDRVNFPRFYVKLFAGHYASMKTDAGNSHGKVFYEKDGVVKMWGQVREEVGKYFEGNKTRAS